MNKPVAKSEKFNVADLSFLRDFWVNNYAHVTLTAEADSLSTDARQLVEDNGLVGCHPSRSNDLSVRARIDFQKGTQQVHHFKVDVIAGDANAAAYKYKKKAVPRFVKFFGCCHVEKDAT